MSVFKSNQWFSKTEGDGKLVKEIPAEVDGEEVLTSKCRPHVVFHLHWKSLLKRY